MNPNLCVYVSGRHVHHTHPHSVQLGLGDITTLSKAGNPVVALAARVRNFVRFRGGREMATGVVGGT